MEITSGSAVLAAESTGAGPDVLLVHAGVTDQRSWASVVERLPGHRCLTYDARGYGRTTYEPEDGWSSVGDAVAVLDAYDVAQAVVIGSSMGGRTSIDLTLLHPDRVRALVLIGPAISGAPEPTYEPEVLALDEEWEAAEERGDLEALNRLEARVWLDGPTAPEGRVQGAVRDLFLEMNGRALAADDPGEQRDDAAAWDRLARDRRTHAGAGRRARPALHPGGLHPCGGCRSRRAAGGAARGGPPAAPRGRRADARRDRGVRGRSLGCARACRARCAGRPRSGPATGRVGLARHPLTIRPVRRRRRYGVPRCMRPLCSSSKTAGPSVGRPTAPRARPSVRRCSPPG